MSHNAQKIYGYRFLIPGIIVFGVFFVLPTILGLILSFSNIRGFDISTLSFAGITNYKNIFTDQSMNTALGNSFLFAIVTTIGKMGFGLLLAVFLNRKIKSANVLRAIYFLPAIINPVAVGLIFTSLMHPTTGLINKFLNGVGLGFLAQNWLTDTKLAIWSVIAIEIWKWTGFTMSILLAGLQSIPKDYYEAATIDGANAFQCFRNITIPLLMPSINNTLILSIVGGLKIFDLVQATTGGGPGSATQVFGTLIYKAFGSGRFSEGCAAGIALAIIIAVIVLPLNRFISRKEVEV